MNSRFIPAAMAMSALALAACGSDQGNGGSAGPTPSPYTGTLTAAGSTALQPMVQAAAGRFQDANPNATVTVDGGGSGTGLSRVASGQADIGDSDIPVGAASNITGADQLVDHQVAAVAFTIIVNPGVTGVTNLTQAQAQGIIGGTITKWSDVGGPANLDVKVVLRPASSGTHKVFNKVVMGGVADITTPSAIQDSTKTVVQIVGQTPGAVSYVALSGLDSTVTAVSYEGVAASVANVENGTYKIWSHEHMYTKGQPAGVVKGFLDYILSDTFQNLLTSDPDLSKLKFIPSSKIRGQSMADA